MGSQSKKIKRGAGDHRGNVGGKKFAGNKRCPVCDEEYSYTSRTRVNCGRKKCREEYRLSYHRRRSDKQKKAQSEYGAKWYQRNKKRIKKEHKYKLENDPLYRKKCKDDHRKYHELQQKKIKNEITPFFIFTSSDTVYYLSYPIEQVQQECSLHY